MFNESTLQILHLILTLSYILYTRKASPAERNAGLNSFFVIRILDCLNCEEKLYNYFFFRTIYLDSDIQDNSRTLKL